MKEKLERSVLEKAAKRSDIEIPKLVNNIKKSVEEKDWDTACEDAMILIANIGAVQLLGYLMEDNSQ